MSLADLERLMDEMHDLVDGAEAEIAAIKRGIEVSREQADNPARRALPAPAVAPALVISAQMQRNSSLSPKRDRPIRLSDRLGDLSRSSTVLKS